MVFLWLGRYSGAAPTRRRHAAQSQGAYCAADEADGIGESEEEGERRKEEEEEEKKKKKRGRRRKKKKKKRGRRRH